MKSHLTKKVLHFSIFFITLTSLVYSCKKDTDNIEISQKEDLKSNQTGTLYYGHETFTRGQGSPVTETRTISNIDFGYFTNDFTLHIANGAQGENKVTSAVVKINGVQIAGPSDFSQNVDIITKPVNNLTQNASLEVEVRGAPGSYIDLWIEGQLQQGYFYITSSGGTFSNGNLQLIIPDNALQDYGIIYFGVTGNEPESVPNPDLEISESPFTIKLPTDNLLKSLQVVMPIPENINEDSDVFVFQSNGKYYPFEYSISGSELIVTIDDLLWIGTQTKSSTEFTLFGLMLHLIQSPPLNMMGLRDATAPVCPPDFITPITPVNANSRIALLIHGWVGAPTIFDQLIPHMKTEGNLNYTHYWTFGYNTAHSISSNAAILADLLQSHANGAHIDIIAHSMGGLVARAYIENYGGDQFIDKLVTIGSPHNGSPLAAIRNYIGMVIGLTVPYNFMNYNYNTQGWRDLRVNSNFIEDLQDNLTERAPNIPYYTIACQNNPKGNLFIEGDDDGIVGVTSALGIAEAGQPSNLINFQEYDAHRLMTRHDPIEQQVIDYLGISVPGITVTTPVQGAVWQKGSQQTITWTSTGITGQVQVRCDYPGSSNTVGWTDIANGQLTFTVPYNWPSRNDWQVAVTAFNYNSSGDDIYDWGEQFSIVNQLFTDEFQDLNNNQVPDGWSLIVENPTVTFSGGRLVAQIVDAYGSLQRTGSVPYGTNEIDFEWDGSLYYSYWGMCNPFQINFGNSKYLRIYAQMAAVNNSVSNRIFMIYNNGTNVTLYQKNIPMVNGEYHFKIRLFQNYLEYSARNLSNNNLFFSETIAIPSYIGFGFDQINAVRYTSYTTTDQNCWLDNLSIDIVN